jgi:hypothetical protein
MAYIIRHLGVPVGLVILGIPHATRCRGWWGYEGLPTQWQVVDLSRIWISAYYQRGDMGVYAQPGIVPGFTDRRGIWRPAVASWAIGEVLARVQADRVRLGPTSNMAEWRRDMDFVRARREGRVQYVVHIHTGEVEHTHKHVHVHYDGGKLEPEVQP